MSIWDIYGKMEWYPAQVLGTAPLTTSHGKVGRRNVTFLKVVKLFINVSKVPVSALTSTSSCVLTSPPVVQHPNLDLDENQMEASHHMCTDLLETPSTLQATKIIPGRHE